MFGVARASTRTATGREKTEENHCYENAQANRSNGILKQEYKLGACFQAKAQARQAVWLYDELRPHLSLDYRTPSEVHQRGSLQKKEKAPNGKVENVAPWLEVGISQQAFSTFPQARLRGYKTTNINHQSVNF